MKNKIKTFAKNIVYPIMYNLPKGAPDFIFVGMTRSGSTYLYNILPQHPDIYLPEAKEINYFNNVGSYDKNLKGYAHFFYKYNNQKFYGEITPTYNELGDFYDANGNIRPFRRDDDRPSPIERITKHFPDTKIIVSLRDPISRINSLYSKAWLQGYLSHSLKEEIVEESEQGYSLMNLMFRQRYDLFLENIYKFIPQENVHIMVFENWIKSQTPELNKLAKFIGADPLPEWKALDESRQNKVERFGSNTGKQGKKIPNDIDEATKQIIIKELEPVKRYMEDKLNLKPDWDY